MMHKSILELLKKSSAELQTILIQELDFYNDEMQYINIDDDHEYLKESKETIDRLTGIINEISAVLWRNKQKKKYVNWLCPLLRGVATNFGALLTLHDRCKWRVSDLIVQFPSTNDLRFVPQSFPQWESCNTRDVKHLHDAGFLFKVKYTTGEMITRTTIEDWSISKSYFEIVAYCVVGIRPGYTDNLEETK